MNSKLSIALLSVFFGGELFADEGKFRAMMQEGGNVTLTIHPEAGHDVWTETFQGTKVENWLLSHKSRSAKKTD